MMRSLATSICLLPAFFLVGCDQSGVHHPTRHSDRPGDSQAHGDADAQAGQRLISERRFAEAIPRLKQALGKPLAVYTRSDVLTMIGNCYNELEQFEESLEYHDKAIKEDPKNHKAYVNKGVVYRLIGDYDKAAQCYSKALELAPDYAELHASMGALAVFQGDYDTAIEQLERAIELDDTVPVAHSNLALAYASVGRFDDAEEELRKAVLRGYHQPDAVKERIERLRKMSDKSE